MFACLSLCSYAQAPLSTEVVTGSFEALYKKTANLEIEYIKIHNRSEAEFAEYEKDWVVDKPEVEDEKAKAFKLMGISDKKQC